jgi:hypothetical protein
MLQNVKKNSNLPVPHQQKKSSNNASVQAPNFSRKEGEPESKFTRFGKASSSALITPSGKQSHDYGNNAEFKGNFSQQIQQYALKLPDNSYYIQINCTHFSTVKDCLRLQKRKKEKKNSRFHNYSSPGERQVSKMWTISGNQLFYVSILK